MPLTPVVPWEDGTITAGALNARVNALIAELQASVTPSATQALILPSGSTAEAGAPAPSCFTWGPFCFIQGSIARSPITTWTTVAQLPVGITPALSLVYSTQWGSSGSSTICRVLANRNIDFGVLSGTPSAARFSMIVPI